MAYLKYSKSLFKQVQKNDDTTDVNDNKNTDVVSIYSQPSYHATLKSLTRKRVFILFTVGVSLTLSTFGSALVYLVEYLESKYGEQDALLLYLYMNISNTFGRLLPGLCALIPRMNVLMISAICTGLSSFTVACIPVASSYYQHVGLVCIFGMTIGCNDTCMSMTTRKLLGSGMYAIGLGILMTVAGLSCIGWIADETGSYDASCYAVAVLHGVALCLFSLATVLQKCKKKESYNIQQVDDSTHDTPKPNLSEGSLRSPHSNQGTIMNCEKDWSERPV
ncbi:uncharacterized protein [Argopecten irradians]|uniref:uncharacterized protein n=1 Tax=Argopecten irradians TaxID=31199 RepID=UPI0037215A8B